MALSPALIVFDCDGVLVDSEPIALRVMLDSFAQAGLVMEMEEAQDRFLGRSLSGILEILRRDHRLDLDEAALEAMRLSLYAAFRAELQPIPGIAEAVDGLRVPYCVASSSQPERVRVSLAATGLLERFEPHIFSATMVPRGKPSPDLFLFAAARMGVAPQDCLVIEDSPAGLEAARRAGMPSFAFVGASHAQGPAHRARLSAHGPRAIFDDMRRLPDLLSGAYVAPPGEP